MLGPPPQRITKRPVCSKHLAIELVGEVHRLRSVVGKPFHLAVSGRNASRVRPWSGKGEMSVRFNRPMDRLYLTRAGRPWAFGFPCPNEARVQLKGSWWRGRR